MHRHGTLYTASVPFSFSQLSTYQTCPRQYEFASIKKIPRQISAGESFGSSVHNTLKKWGELELAHLPPKEHSDAQLTLFMEEAPNEHDELTVDTLLAMWNTSFIVEGYESKTDADIARKRGEEILRMFYDWWKQSEREVMAIEKSFSLEVDMNTVKGRFDRIEKSKKGMCVVDFKTGAVRSQQETDDDMQLSIYALAAEEMFGEPCVELLLLFLREDGVTEVRTTRSSEQLADASERICELAAGIDDEQFAPTPSLAVCSRCPYRGICDAATL